MDKTFFFNEIDDLLNVINEQHEIIKTYDFYTPQIEIDLIKANIRRLYDYYHKIDKLNNRAEEPIVEATAAVPAKVKIVKDVLPDVSVGEKKSLSDAQVKIESVPDDVSPKEVAPKEIVVEAPQAPKADAAPIVAPAPKIVEIPVSVPEESQPKATEIPNKKRQEKKPKRKPVEVSGNLFTDQPLTIGDKLKASEKPSLHEKIDVSAKNSSLISRLQSKSIKDLKSAIGLNDKFLFINQLFHGSLGDYTDAIEKFNKAENPESALEMLETLRNDRDWDETTEAYQKLLGFLEKRFSVE